MIVRGSPWTRGTRTRLKDIPRTVSFQCHYPPSTEIAAKFEDIEKLARGAEIFLGEGNVVGNFFSLHLSRLFTWVGSREWCWVFSFHVGYWISTKNICVLIRWTRMFLFASWNILLSISGFECIWVCGNCCFMVIYWFVLHFLIRKSLGLTRILFRCIRLHSKLKFQHL